MKVGVSAVASCVLACSVFLLLSREQTGSGGRASLYQFPGKGGGLYGFSRDETAVNTGERRWAMQTLQHVAGRGVKLLTAKDAADEQLRWLRPYYAREMRKAHRVWGAGQVSSAVDVEGRSVAYTAVHADKQSAWAKAAMGSRTVPLDAQVVPSSQAREKADAAAVKSAAEDKAAWTQQLYLGKQQSLRWRRPAEASLETSLNRVMSPLTSFASGGAEAAKMQQLAEIYGVRISDKDAYKFFGTDYEKKYKPASPQQLHDYIMYLADNQPPKPVNATVNATEGEEEKDAAEEEEKEEEECVEGDEGCEKKHLWPSKARFGKKIQDTCGHPVVYMAGWSGGNSLPNWRQRSVL